MENRESLPDLYNIWNYSKPEETRKRFGEIIPLAEQSGDISYLLQLQTQIARTYSLEGNFESAHKILDEVEPMLTSELTLVRIRYLLERGRTFNSAGEKTKAQALFTESYTLSVANNEDFCSVDAAHMVAIATPESKDKEKWNLIGVEIAESSKNERARNWLGSLYNNIGWDYFDQERYPEALTKFEKALEYQIVRADSADANTDRISIARWCVAKGFRFVGRIDEALTIQNELLIEHEQNGSSDGYVFEELGELYLLQNKSEKSREHFAEAYEELSKDSWLMRNESERIERLKKLGHVE